MKRLGFHAIAFIVGMIVGGTVLSVEGGFGYSGRALNDIIGGIITLTYLSLLILVPQKSDRFSSKIGLFSALVALSWAPWQFVLSVGAFPAFFIQCINRKKMPFSACFVMVLITLCLTVESSIPEILAKVIPDWYVGFLIGMTLFGCYGNKILLVNKLYDFVYNLPPREKSAIVVDKHIETVLESSVVTASNGQQIIKAEIQQHRDIIQKLIHYHKQLPYDLSRYLTAICEYSFKILNSMEKDPRDFEPGDRFLKRYLKATETILNQFIELSKHSNSVPQINALKEQLAQSLKDLADAFVTQHMKLLENDSTDLTVEVKLVDKLLKMEGFKTDIPPKRSE